LLRWSEDWAQKTYRHTNAKWHLTEDHRVIHERFVRPHRREALRPLRRWLCRLFGVRRGERMLSDLERVIVNRGLRQRARLRSE
jgi:hypothetical protein